MKVFASKIHLRQEEFVWHQTRRSGGPGAAQGIHVQDKGVVTSQRPVSMIGFHLRGQKVCTPYNKFNLLGRPFARMKDYYRRKK